MVSQPSAAPVKDVPVRGRGALLTGLLASIVCVAFESVAVATAMPEAAQELGQVGLYAWPFTLFVLGMVFSTAVTGRLSDRIGPVKPLILGGLLFAIGLVAAGAAQSMLVLVAARFLQGIGGGAMNLCLMVVVASAWDEAERAQIMTWFSFCWVMPAFLGPPISAAITHHVGWKWVFWSIVPALVLAGGVALRPLREVQRNWRPHEESANPVPLWAAACAAIGAALLQAGGQLLGARGAVLAIVALVLLFASVPRIMPPGFLRLRPGLSAVVWSRAAQAGSFFAAESFLPLSLVTQRDLTLFQAGLALTIGSVGWTLGSWIQSRSWLRLRRDQIIGVGMTCTLAGIALITLSAWTGHRFLAVAAVGWSIAGFGMGLGIASGSLAVMELSPAGQLGRSTSSLQSAEGLGNSIAGGLAGTIFHTLHVDGHDTFGWVFVAMTVVALFGMVTASRIGPVRNASAGLSSGPVKMEG